MTKSELKTGMIVTRRDGRELMVCLKVDSGVHDNVLIDVTRQVWSDLDSFTETLDSKYGWDNDIVKVEKVPVFNIANMAAERELLWQREEVKEVTMAEVEEKFGCKVKIVNPNSN